MSSTLLPGREPAGAADAGAVGRFAMTSAKAKGRLQADRAARNEQARREMQSFLEAMHSYPARFAKDRKISFQQHCQNRIICSTPLHLPD